MYQNHQLFNLLDIQLWQGCRVMTLKTSKSFNRCPEMLLGCKQLGLLAKVNLPTTSCASADYIKVLPS